MASAYDIPGLYDYLTRFSGQDEVLARVARETSELPDAVMQSRADQGGLLTLLALMLDAQVAIEVGTFTGYGAICIARGLAEGGQLTCLEVSEEYAEIARRNIASAGLDDRVTVEVGPGRRRRSRDCPEEPHVDLAYVDADKTGYPAYYDALVPRLRPGGVLVLDNTLLRRPRARPAGRAQHGDGRAERADRGRRPRRLRPARPLRRRHARPPP